MPFLILVFQPFKSTYLRTMELHKQLGKFRYNEGKCSSVLMNGSYFAFDCSLFQTVNKLIMFMFFSLKATILSQTFKTAQISQSVYVQIKFFRK